MDTHVWLWWIESPDKLSREARESIEDASNEIFFSSASAWELSIKCGTGKLRLDETPDRFVPPRLSRDGIIPLPVELSHALRTCTLEPIHRDPFDRLLVAQAQILDLTLITDDTWIQRYPVMWLAARS